MFRYKITGSVSPDSLHPRVLICYVTARNREDAVNKAFDDMGLMAVMYVRKVSKKLR